MGSPKMAALRMPAAILLVCASWKQVPTAAPDEALVAARRLFRQGDFRNAATAFRNIIAAAPSPDAYAGLVKSLLKQDAVAASDEASRRSLQAFPNSALVVAAHGDVLFRRGQIAEAKDEYNAAIKLDEKCARAWLGRGKIDAVLARPRHALEAVSKAHQLDPEDGDALYEWAVRQPYPGNVAALERHLSEFHSDPETEGHERDYQELLKALVGRKVWVLHPDVSGSELKLDSLTTGPNLALRGFGLRVKFNDRATATLLLDTGSSGVTIPRKLAEKIGAQKLSDQAIEGVGKNGAAHGYQAWVDKVAIGDLEFHDCFVHVVPSAPADTGGLIGTDLFFKFLVTLDFPARKLRLEPLPDAAETEAEPTVDAKSPTQAYGFGHLLLLPTQVDEKQSGLFVIDSGASISTVSPELGKRIGQMRTLNTPVLGTSGSVNSAQIGEDVSLRFAKVRRRQQIITLDMRSISKDTGTEISGQIGFNTLERMRITIDYRDGWVDFGQKP